MSTNPNDLVAALQKIRYDATAIQAKVTDALNMVAALNLPNPEAVVCPCCGVVLKTERGLAEHLYRLHDRPVPEHWREANAA